MPLQVKVWRQNEENMNIPRFGNGLQIWKRKHWRQASNSFGAWAALCREINAGVLKITKRIRKVNTTAKGWTRHVYSSFHTMILHASVMLSLHYTPAPILPLTILSYPVRGLFYIVICAPFPRTVDTYLLQSYIGCILGKADLNNSYSLKKKTGGNYLFSDFNTRKGATALIH